MVWSGELIEHGIKNKRIKGKATPIPTVKKSTPLKKKEKDTHAIFTNHQSKGHASYASQPSYTTNHLTPMAEGEELIKLKFCIQDGRDVAYNTYMSFMTIAILKQKIVAKWPQGY